MRKRKLLFEIIKLCRLFHCFHSFHLFHFFCTVTFISTLLAGIFVCHIELESVSMAESIFKSVGAWEWARNIYTNCFLKGPPRKTNHTIKWIQHLFINIPFVYTKNARILAKYRKTQRERERLWQEIENRDPPEIWNTTIVWTKPAEKKKHTPNGFSAL